MKDFAIEIEPEYYKDGVKVEADTQTVKQTVQVLEADTLTVDKSAINVTDKYEGYYFDNTEPEVIPEEVTTEYESYSYTAPEVDEDEVEDEEDSGKTGRIIAIVVIVVCAGAAAALYFTKKK